MNTDALYLPELTTMQWSAVVKYRLVNNLEIYRGECTLDEAIALGFVGKEEPKVAPWVDSDGISNLPNTIGIYHLSPNPSDDSFVWWSYFDGVKFHGASGESAELAMFYARSYKYTNEFTGVQGGAIAWRDYQGLMTAQPQPNALEDGQEPDWISREGRTLLKTVAKLEAAKDSSTIRPSDLPGIAAMEKQQAFWSSACPLASTGKIAAPVKVAPAGFGMVRGFDHRLGDFGQ